MISFALKIGKNKTKENIHEKEIKIEQNINLYLNIYKTSFFNFNLEP